MRRWLVIFLAVAAAVLSFDALQARAVELTPAGHGIIPAAALLPRWALGALWALVIDGAAAAGVLGIREDRRDPRAWSMFCLAAAASVAFQQVWTAPVEWSVVLGRAVPPVALVLAIVVLDLAPRRGEVPEVGAPAPAALPGALPNSPRGRPHANPPSGSEASPANDWPGRTAPARLPARSGPSTRQPRALTPAERAKVDRRAAAVPAGATPSARAIASSLGLPYHPVRAYLNGANMAPTPSANGASAPTPTGGAQ